MNSHTLNLCGPQIRKLRSQRGWSQAQLVIKCQLAGWDISRDILASIEIRRRLVRDEELMQLSIILGVSLEELFPKGTRTRLSRPR